MRGLAVSTLCIGLAIAGGPPEYLRPAQQAFQTGDLVQAESLMQQAVREHPKDPNAFAFLGIILDRENKHAEAGQALEVAVALDPQSAPLLFNLGTHYATAGDYARAQTLLQRVIGLRPQDAAAHLQLARIAVEQKHGQDALRYLAPLARETDPGVRMIRGMAYALTGAFGNAEEEFAAVAQQQPGNPDIQYQLGLAAAHAGHFERAQAALQAVDSARPRDADVLFALGRVYAARNDAIDAIAALGQARKLRPKDPDILLALARAFEDSSFLGDSAEIYGEYLALRPNDRYAARDYALVIAATGRTDQGLRQLKEYVAHYPRDPEGFYDLGLVVGESDPNAGIASLDKALALRPAYASAHLARAMFLRQLSRMRDAIPDLETARKEAPGNAVVLLNLGLTFQDLGQNARAEEVLREAAKNAPEDRAVLMHLGQVLAAEGKNQESAVVLAKVEKMGPAQRMGGRAPVMLDLLKLSPAELEARAAEKQKSKQVN